MKDVKAIAREAGMVYREFEDEFANANTDGVDIETLERFASIIRAECAEVCKKRGWYVTAAAILNKE
jgi:hypothetical protein